MQSDVRQAGKLLAVVCRWTGCFAWEDGGGRVRAVPSVDGSCRLVRAQLAVRVRLVSSGAYFFRSTPVAHSDCWLPIQRVVILRRWVPRDVFSGLPATLLILPTAPACDSPPSLS